MFFYRCIGNFGVVRVGLLLCFSIGVIGFSFVVVCFYRRIENLGSLGVCLSTVIYKQILMYLYNHSRSDLGKCLNLPMPLYRERAYHSA